MVKYANMGRMKLRIFTEPQQGASYDTLLRVARAAEDLGFDAFFRSDHYLSMGDVSGLPGPTDAWVTLAALARETSRIRLGTLVSPATFRLPGPLAITVAQVDQMSDGRVELGMGAGWYEAEHTAYGIAFPPLGERFDRFEEQLEIITGLWDEPDGGRFSFKGTYFTVADSPALPKPVQRPRPPLIIGGAGKRRAPRLAAKFADEYNVPFAQPGGHGRRVRPGAGGLRRCRAARELDDLLGRPHGVLRPVPGRDRPAGRGGRQETRRGPRGHARRDRRDDRAVR